MRLSRNRPAGLWTRAVAIASDRDLGLFLTVRVSVWALVALTLLWTPIRDPAAIAPFRAYDALTDLLFDTFAQWDSVWFIHVADFGYDSRQITAFFPLYPLAVSAIAFVTQSTVVAGVLVSLAAGCATVLLLKRVAAPVLSAHAQRDAILLLALFPVGYVFTAVYSDALFLALATGSFLAAQRRCALLAGVLGGLAVATRLMGLALVPALIVLLWPRHRSWREASRLAPVLLLPLALAGYALYLQHRFGDATAFVDAQTGEPWNRELSVLGPLSGVWEAAAQAWHASVELALHLPRGQNAPDGYHQLDVWAFWNVVHFALLVVAAFLTWVAWKRLGPAFGLYSASVLVIATSAPAQFVPLTGLPRFLLADFPALLALAGLLEQRRRLRFAILLAFAAASSVAAVAFSRHVWIA